MTMQSHNVHTLLVIPLLVLTLAGAIIAAPPESTSQDGNSSAMPGVPASPSQEIMGADGAGAAQAPIRLSPEQRQMIGVTYGTVEQTVLKKTIRAVGRVDFDERRLADVTFKVSGWVQELFIDYTGKRVRKGEPLLTLYSPDLVTSQEEYLLALRTRDQLATSSLPEARTGSQGLVDAARRRLLLWDLTPQQL